MHKDVQSGRPERRRFDLIAYDHDRPFLLVEVKRAGDIRSLAQMAEDLSRYVEASTRHAPCFMIALPQQILLYRYVALHEWQLAHSFDANPILRQYDEHYGESQVHEAYLASLVEAWLSDIAFHWSGKEPPGEDIFAKLDLVNALRRGSTEIDAGL
jgi:hypothetical protein